LFLSSNSSPSVANVTISGNTITITANLVGSTTVNVCSLANTTNCASFTVTVQSSSISPITFSQSNVTVPYSQNISVTIGGGTGTYSVVSNSSPTVIQATVSGSTVNLYGSANSGTSVITVCSSNMSSCGVINATASPASTSSIVFSQNNPSLTPGQVSSVTVSGGTGSYYVSSNTNTGVVQTNIVGNTLTLTGNAVGSSVVTVCASTGGCGLLNVTVATAGTSISLSQTTATLTVGQIINVLATGAGNYIIQNNTNPNVASASVSGNTVIINGISVGTSNITVCQSGGQCAIIYVTVTSSSSGSTFAPSPSTLTIPVGQTANSALPGSGSYYISNNSAPSIATALVNGSYVAVTGVSAGTANITLCQSFGQCAILGVTVTGTSTTVTNTTSTPTTVSTPSIMLTQVLSVGQGINLMISGGAIPYSLSSNSGSVFTAKLTGSVLTLTGVGAGISSINICSSNNICGTVNVVVVKAAGSSSGSTSNESSSGSTSSSANSYKFSRFLSVGSSGKEVTELQMRLKQEGVFNGPVTGYYGPQTEAAVKDFQKLHGIDQRGYVGPGTRAELNK
jgi:ferredoxin